ncbi:unnamed protein product [Spirodela intermedia]|uniref:Zinc finger PHD-type domain-containing protein n=1 Tax=Spirodela intermedia TaxID=51605 RepID=A0A7I8L1H0_SPIIN|nr:unnamed protein product [Spirodela intermedia]
MVMKERVRTLKELYEITLQISEPKITPVLKGIYHIQGPVIDVERDTGKNLIFLPKEKGFVNRHLRKDIHMKGSGTCNVCAAPCSSCMHFNQATSYMESKAEGGYSENSCAGKEADNCSFSDAETPVYKSKQCDDRMHAASETSKIFISNFSHDSFSENAERKAIGKNTDLHDASEGVDMPLKVSPFETDEENQLVAENSASSPSSRKPVDSSMLPKTFSNPEEGPNGLECHGDNISCVTSRIDRNIAANDLHKNMGREDMPCTSTSALHSGGFKMSSLAQAVDGDIVELHSDLWKSDKLAKESSQMKSASSNSLNLGSPHNPSDSRSLNSNPSPREHCLHPSSGIESSFHSDAGLKDKKESSISHLQGEPLESFVDPVEPCVREQVTAVDMDEQKCDRFSKGSVNTNYEISKDNDMTVHASSPRASGQFSESKTGEHGMSNEELGKSISSVGTSNSQEPQPIPELKLEDDYPVPDILEDDVKVCDICGDAGREDLLAICSRCSDGAEHTYCMRVMLGKLPEGNWLCEECTIKDMATFKVEKSEILLATLKEPRSAEKIQKVGSSFSPKALPKLDVSATDAEAPLPIIGLKSSEISMKRSLGKADVTLLTSSKVPDTSGISSMTASPSRKSMLSRESSSKSLDAGKVKQGNLTLPSVSQSSSSPAISRSLAPVANSPKIQGQIQPSRGLLSRSGSFTGLKPKVKQVIENVPQKPQVIKESASGDIKEGFMRTLGKSVSLKNISPGLSESTSKSQSVVFHRPEESRNQRQNKERTMERKNSLVLNRNLPSAPVASIPSVSLSKTDSKAIQSDGKVSSVSEQSTSHSNVGSENTYDKGLKELKKQTSSKIFGNPPANVACNLADDGATQVVTKEDAHVGPVGDVNTLPQHTSSYSCNRDEKIKDSSTFGSSRPLAPSSKRILRCQRCNEAGHSTQFCSIDKIRVSALKPSAERSSREAVTKGNKWKDAVDIAISKGRGQKSLPDRSEDISSNDLGSEIVSQSLTSTSFSCVKDLSTPEGLASKQNSSRGPAADVSKTPINDVKQPDPQMATACTNRDDESDSFSTQVEDLKAKPLMQILPGHQNLILDPFRISVLPEHEYIWQGSFDLKRSGRLPEICDGFQAHLSTRAAPKVPEVVTKFPEKVQLEEVTRLSSWPLQFQEEGPTEENIALFFFAKDVKSYEKGYRKLLETMIKNDLALKGNFDGIELLIFPSTNLPEKSQRWNRLFFLWGVFRERRPNCPETRSVIESKPAIADLDLESPPQELPTQPVTEIPSLKREPKGIPTKGLLVNAEAVAMLGAERKASHVDNESPAQRTSSPGATDCVLVQPDKNPSHATAAIDSSTCKSGEIGLQGASPDSRIKDRGGAQPCLEIKSRNGASQVNSSDNNPATDGSRPKCGAKSNPWPPDLNLESQDVEDEPAEPPPSHHPAFSPPVGNRDDEKVKDTGWPAAATNPLWDAVLAAAAPDKKRARSHSPLPFGGSFNVPPWRQITTERTSLDGEGEGKKRMRLHREVAAAAVAAQGGGSSKIHPLLGSFQDERRQQLPTGLTGVFPESSWGSERHFFPLSTAGAGGLILPTVAAPALEEDELPNLELALGGAEKRPPKRGILPFPFPAAGRSKRQARPPDYGRQEVDDESASLSLSLAFPFSGKEQVKPPAAAPRPEKRPPVGTSLLLFDGFADG